PLAPAISPLEAYRRATAKLGDLLGELTPVDWHRPALRDMDVQALVGHLIGVEQHFQAGAGLRQPVAGADNHITSTEPFAAAQAGRDPAATRAELQGLIDASLAGLTAAGDEALTRPATMHGMTLPLGGLLIVRAFELWTHDDDIRRATGREVASPDASALHLMTELAVALL